jgi:hypothetical protein
MYNIILFSAVDRERDYNNKDAKKRPTWLYVFVLIRGSLTIKNLKTVIPQARSWHQDVLEMKQ